MTELERLDAEISRVEARISFLDDQFFELQRRVDHLRDQLAVEDDPRIKAEITAQIGRAIEKIDDNRDEQQQMHAEGDELGRAYRAEQAFQESLKASPKMKGDDERDISAGDDAGGGDSEANDWLERRRLKRERKRKIGGM